MKALDVDVCFGDEVLTRLDSGELKLWESSVSDKAIACVNALAGRDPAKLDALVEAAGPIRDWVLQMRDDVDGATVLRIDAFTAALAAFEGAEMSEIKDYGEPWAYNNDRTPSMERSRPAYQDRAGKAIPGKSSYADDGAVRDRALACVNALAGRDPAKLDALVKAARDSVFNSFRSGEDEECGRCSHMWVVENDSFDKLRTALAAFDGGRHE